MQLFVTICLDCIFIAQIEVGLNLRMKCDIQSQLGVVDTMSGSLF